MNPFQRSVFTKFQQAIPGSPHIAQKFGASIAEKGLSRKAGNLTVKPQQSKSVTAKVSEGNPLVNMNLDSGMGLAPTFTLVMDMSTVGGGTGNGKQIPRRPKFKNWKEKRRLWKRRSRN